MRSGGKGGWLIYNMLQFVRKSFSTKAEKAGALSCRRKHCLPEYSRQKTNMDHTKKKATNMDHI
jgi:hypothetical protein